MVANAPRVRTLGLERVDVSLCVCALTPAEMAALLTPLLPYNDSTLTIFYLDSLTPTHHPSWVVGLEPGSPPSHSHGTLLYTGIGEVADPKEKGETLNNG